MEIKVLLKSDLCVSSGESIAGIIDTEVTFDRYGFPIIPSKRFKGCLKAAAKDILDIYEGKYKKSFRRLFGKSGDQFTDSMLISNGYIKDYKKIRESLKKAINNENYNIFFQPENIKENYTTIRTQTKIDKKSRTAAEKSLRNTRVINKGLKFYFDIKNIHAEDVDLLEKCCNVFRHMGMNRTRGLGEIECTLIKEAKQGQRVILDANNYVNINDDFVKLNYTLELNSQIIMTSTFGNSADIESYVTGSSILGYFAYQYIRKNNLGLNAHKDRFFKRVFLDGEVEFSNAYITDSDNNVYIPSPEVVVKTKDFDEYYDISIENNLKEQYNLLKNKYINIVSDYLKIRTPDASIEYHHKRPEDRSVGKVINRKESNENEGKFYSYISLSEGNKFRGSIIGKKNDIEKIIDLLPEDNIIQIGKSKTAQYAKTKFTIINDNNIYDDEINMQNKFKIILTSPMILVNDLGHVYPELDILIKKLDEKIRGLKLEKTFLKYKTVSGFNARWTLPRQVFRALDAGSILIFSYKGNKNPKVLENESYGLKTNEGYGRVQIDYIINNNDNIELLLEDEKNNSAFEIIQADESTKNLLYRIQKKMIIQQAKYNASEKAKKDYQEINVNSTTINALINILKKCNNKQEFFDIIKNIKKEAKMKKCEKIINSIDVNKIITQIDVYQEKSNYLCETLKAEIQPKQALDLYYYKEIMMAYLNQLKYEGRQEK